jgi:cytochrome c peroxidase
MWDGRRDTAYNQVFGVIENPLEFNSSLLFVAQQIIRFYRAPYEELFGPLPALDGYETIEAPQAGCEEMPEDQVHDRCIKPGRDDDDVLGIIANMGKAIGAYERGLSCGPSRFDAWMHGDLAALDADEQAGAVLFVQHGCDECHSGPALTDQAFHNVGAANRLPNFIEPFEDPGAAVGLREALDDRLNSRGPFSDADDGRLDGLDPDDPALLGAFRTPGLRCVNRRPSFMHAAQVRSLDDAVRLFVKGGDSTGFVGEKDPRMVPLDIDSDERAQLVAFLRALEGPGPDAAAIAEPILPGTE